MKKLIALLLAVVMVLGLAACATKAETPATDTPATDTPAASTETETKTKICSGSFTTARISYFRFFCNRCYDYKSFRYYV